MEHRPATLARAALATRKNHALGWYRWGSGVRTSKRCFTHMSGCSDETGSDEFRKTLSRKGRAKNKSPHSGAILSFELR
jgi:hypothetical protein